MHSLRNMTLKLSKLTPSTEYIQDGYTIYSCRHTHTHRHTTSMHADTHTPTLAQTQAHTLTHVKVCVWHPHWPLPPLGPSSGPSHHSQVGTPPASPFHSHTNM